MRKFLARFLLISFFIILVSLLLIPGFGFAQKELEVEYPEVEKFRPETTETLLPDYVKYIFNFAIWASGFIALGALVYGGFKYLTSIGMPEKLKDAKEQIAAALLGLLILFASYLILITINPQLIIFHLGPIPPPISTLKPGVLVCKEPEKGEPPLLVMSAWELINEAKDEKTSIERKIEIRDQLDPIMRNISKYCYEVTGGGDVRKEFDNKIKYVYFIPDRTSEDPREAKFYGAIIYEGKGFGDESAVLFQSPGTDRPFEYNYQDLEWKGIEVSSIRCFVFSDEEPEDKAIAYEEIDFNWGTTGLPAQDKDIGVRGENKFVEAYGFSFTPQSIEIKGNYIVVLYTAKGESEAFIEPGDADLNNNRVACGQWCSWHGFPYRCKKSCVMAAMTIRGKLY